MKTELIHELSTNFIDYAAAVNSDRAIPDATSGLKPVARRILWSAYNSGYFSTKEHVKCGRIVGDVIGMWHPHGDTSVYGALVTLSKPWYMRYPLIDFHGNLGNIGGDGPAAYRYTNARLAKITEVGLLEGLKKNNVDFVPNYDENDFEPVTLPSIFPNLLCNPNTGIGVAMACNWLPHNLGEVAQAIFDYLDGKEPSIIGPDFPTGGLIINKDDLPAIIKKGKGTVKLRAKYKTEKDCIVFYEIPYGCSIESLMTELGDVVDKKEIEDIIDIRDETNLKGIRVVVQCAKGANLDIIANKIFAKTDFQTTISYNQVALVDKVPTELGLIDCIKIYINHNIDCLTREIKFDKTKCEERLNIVNGLLKALEDIDNIVTLIKKSASSSAAKDELIAKYGFNEPQAKAIVAMRLGSLAGLEKMELNKECAELNSKLEKFNTILSSEEKKIEVIRERLSALVSKFGDERRTELTNISITKEEKEKELIVPQDCVVVMSQTGLVKRIPTSSFKVQKRNGKGVKSESDAILDIISTNTVDSLLLFTDKGKMYKVAVNDIPEGNNATKGISVYPLIKSESGEKVIAITSLYKDTKAKYVVFLTKRGMIKKSSLEEYNLKKSSGIIATKLKDGDEVANITFIDEEEMVLLTRKGMSIRFGSKDISPIGRVTTGVKAIKLDDDDEVLVGIPIHKTTDELAVLNEDGTGKKISLADLTLQGRGGKGIKVSTKGIRGGAFISDEDNLLILGNSHSICISAKDVPSTSRHSSGNILIKDSIRGVIKL